MDDNSVYKKMIVLCKAREEQIMLISAMTRGSAQASERLLKINNELNQLLLDIEKSANAFQGLEATIYKMRYIEGKKLVDIATLLNYDYDYVRTINKRINDKIKEIAR